MPDLSIDAKGKVNMLDSYDTPGEERIAQMLEEILDSREKEGEHNVSSSE